METHAHYVGLTTNDGTGRALGCQDEKPRHVSAINATTTESRRWASLDHCTSDPPSYPHQTPSAVFFTPAHPPGDYPCAKRRTALTAGSVLIKAPVQSSCKCMETL